MPVDSWLLVNLGLTFTQFTVLLGLIGSLALNFYQARDRAVAKTIALNNATIKNLETSLAAGRIAFTEAVAEIERWKDNAKRLEDELAERNTEVATLHDEISKLTGRKWKTLKEAREVREKKGI